MIASTFEFGRHHTLAGRGREITFLGAALNRMLDGSGTLVLLVGEAGIGETRIVHELQHPARNADMLVLSGHCFDLPTRPPYGPWLPVLADANLARIAPDARLVLSAQATDQSTLQTRVVQQLTLAAGIQSLLIITGRACF